MSLYSLHVKAIALRLYYHKARTGYISSHSKIGMHIIVYKIRAGKPVYSCCSSKCKAKWSGVGMPGNPPLTSQCHNSQLTSLVCEGVLCEGVVCKGGIETWLRWCTDRVSDWTYVIFAKLMSTFYIEMKHLDQQLSMCIVCSLRRTILLRGKIIITLSCSTFQLSAHICD